jgi:uncharacterized RDD family membrane protein YckC
MSYDNPPGGHGGPPPGGYGPPPGGQQGGGYGPPPGGQQGGGGYGPPPGGQQGGGYGGPPQDGYGGAQQGGYPPPPPQGDYPPQQGVWGPPQGGYAPQAPPNYANWITRVGGYLLDVIPVAIIFGIGRATGSVGIDLIFIIIGIAVTGYNRWYMAGKTGQSWGKKALHITLISEATGQPIGAGMAFVRDICHIVDSIICYVGWLFPLWDAKRQTLADKIVKTVVVPV